MKENSIKPYCYCGESESSLVDNAIFVYFDNKFNLSKIAYIII